MGIKGVSSIALGHHIYTLIGIPENQKTLTEAMDDCSKELDYEDGCEMCPLRYDCELRWDNAEFYTDNDHRTLRRNGSRLRQFLELKEIRDMILEGEYDGS